MSGGLIPEIRNLICSLNTLYDWSLCADEFGAGQIGSEFAEYVSWKLPFPAIYTEVKSDNRAITAFCVERLVCKLKSIESEARNKTMPTKFFRCYCILTEPDLWASEVGIVFSLEKWYQLIHRSVETHSYSETTIATKRSLFDDFGVVNPSGVCHSHMSHTIEDHDEGISFNGGLHVLWIE